MLTKLYYDSVLFPDPHGFYDPNFWLYVTMYKYQRDIMQAGGKQYYVIAL